MPGQEMTIPRAASRHPAQGRGTNQGAEYELCACLLHMTVSSRQFFPEAITGQPLALCGFRKTGVELQVGAGLPSAAAWLPRMCGEQQPQSRAREGAKAHLPVTVVTSLLEPKLLTCSYHRLLERQRWQRNDSGLETGDPRARHSFQLEQVQNMDVGEAHSANAVPVQNVVIPEAHSANAVPVQNMVIPEAHSASAVLVQNMVIPEAHSANAVPVQNMVIPEAHSANAVPVQNMVIPEAHSASAVPVQNMVIPEARSANAVPVQNMVVPEAHSASAVPVQNMVIPEAHSASPVPVQNMVIPEAHSASTESLQNTVLMGEACGEMPSTTFAVNSLPLLST